MALRLAFLGTACTLALALASCGNASAPAGGGAGFVCPPRAPAEERLADQNENPKAGDATVPGGPDQVPICHYRGMNQGDPGFLGATSRVSDETEVRDIADQINELRPYVEEAHSCPMEEGRLVYALFHYPQDPPVIVRVELDGCTSADNGHAEGGYPPAGLLRRFEQLTPLPGEGKLTLDRRCPAEISEPRDGFPQGGVRGHTAPPGPTAALVCSWSYGLAAGPAREERASRLLTGAAAAHLADVLNRLPKPEGIETEGCGGGPELIYLIRLAYPGRPEIPIYAHLGEAEICDYVYNELDHTGFSGNRELEQTLKSQLSQGGSH